MRKNQISPKLLLVTLLSLLFVIPLTSCDPHRKGAVSGQMGGKVKSRKHVTPASSKNPRKSRYK
jgi:hypothetical protein